MVVVPRIDLKLPQADLLALHATHTIHLGERGRGREREREREWVRERERESERVRVREGERERVRERGKERERESEWEREGEREDNYGQWLQLLSNIMHRVLYVSSSVRTFSEAMMSDEEQSHRWADGAEDPVGVTLRSVGAM
jgi:hypothetical protein